jgi:hypothetical protein
MKRSVIALIVFLGFILAGCETAIVDDPYVAEDMYSDRLAYIYDYSEAVPTESGIFRSGQAVVEGIVDLGEAWTHGVEVTMREVDVLRAGKELEIALCRLYQQSLYED